MRVSKIWKQPLFIAKFYSTPTERRLIESGAETERWPRLRARPAIVLERSSGG
jgi:hypothetical protein